MFKIWLKQNTEEMLLLARLPSGTRLQETGGNGARGAGEPMPGCRRRGRVKRLHL